MTLTHISKKDKIKIYFLLKQLLPFILPRWTPSPRAQSKIFCLSPPMAKPRLLLHTGYPRLFPRTKLWYWTKAELCKRERMRSWHNRAGCTRGCLPSRFWCRAIRLNRQGRDSVSPYNFTGNPLEVLSG